MTPLIGVSLLPQCIDGELFVAAAAAAITAADATADAAAAAADFWYALCHAAPWTPISLWEILCGVF